MFKRNTAKIAIVKTHKPAFLLVWQDNPFWPLIIREEFCLMYSRPKWICFKFFKCSIIGLGCNLVTFRFLFTSEKAGFAALITLMFYFQIGSTAQVLSTPKWSKNICFLPRRTRWFSCADLHQWLTSPASLTSTNSATIPTCALPIRYVCLVLLKCFFITMGRSFLMLSIYFGIFSNKL